jgi:hypothetical protein
VLWTLRPIRWKDKDDRDRSGTVVALSRDLWWPLADFTYAGFIDADRARLDELTVVAVETRAGADLVLGRHGELAAELEAWCRAHPRRRRRPATCGSGWVQR